ncbi:hypothetical protein LX87_04507 [Larkinella arboricola]|uniref:Uncharacterized protein n=2 Tax=Larkinella arboricola TaxID=643671 RepID=A0A327WN22_LARAB|nr:hypothetical protein LX87_04507 [Larkinella arboricola]
MLRQVIVTSLFVLQWLFCLCLMGLQPSWGHTGPIGFASEIRKDRYGVYRGDEGGFGSFGDGSCPTIVITQQPISRTACSGNGIKYSVQVDGTNLTYDWEFIDPGMTNWLPLSRYPSFYPGYNTATLTTNGEEADGRQYRVQINNGSCSATSQPATFTKLASPIITQQPADHIACSSIGLDYRVQVKQEENLSYDWEYKDSNSSDWYSLSANPNAYQGYDTGVLITNGDEPSGRQYRVKVNNGYCPIYSNPVTFTKLREIVITRQPISHTVCSGNGHGLTYSVQADGDDLAYEWEFKDPTMTDWVSFSDFANTYPDYTTATLTANGVETPGRKYRVKIINDCGTIYSDSATFTVPTSVITQQPTSRTACLASNNGLKYTVVVESTGQVIYDWEFKDPNTTDWVSLGGSYAQLYPGYDTPTLTTNGNEANGRQYRVKIMNSCGTPLYSQSATFTLATTPPVITQQPISRTACSANNNGLKYTVVVESTDQVIYDWEFKDPDIDKWKPLSDFAEFYPGYNTATLTTNGIETPGRQYRVKINNGCAYSESATFTLAPTPSITQQPVSRTACSGKNLQYEVKAEGTDLTYDWEYNDGGGWASLSFDSSVYPGYNSATLTTNGDEPTGRQYRVKVTNGSCTVYSQPATYTQIQCTPTLTNFSAAPKSVAMGQSIEFSATVGSVTGPYNYTLTNGAGSTQTGTASGPSFSQRLTAQGTGIQTYTLTIGNSLYAVTGTVSVTVASFAITGLKARANHVKSGQSVEFTATLTGLVDADIYSYTLTNGQEETPLTGDYHGPDYRESVTAQGSGSQTYTLTVTTQKGTATAAVSVTVIGEDVGSERFAISGVRAESCETLSGNQRQVRFTPQYVGINGEPISFSVVNELGPTTQPGPYTLHLYTDNPTITLVAQQGSRNEVRFVYKWLAACTNGSVQAQPPTTSGIPSQTLGVGQSYQLGLTDYITDPDGQMPRFAAQSLPQGLSLLESVISGIPSVTGTYPVSVTATDPGGLSIIVTFQLTITPTMSTSPDFSIGGVSPVSCALVDSVKQGYQVRFMPQYGGLNGQPISFSVVNELGPTTQPGPYTLRLYADNPSITLVAQQGNYQTQYTYNWTDDCQATSSGARKALVEEIGAGLQVKLLGNPITNHQIWVEVKGVEGQSVDLTLSDLNGRHLTSERIERAGQVEQHNLEVSPDWGGVLLLRVRVVSPTRTQQQTVKVIQGCITLK